MKKYLTLFLTAALLIAALAVPASAQEGSVTVADISGQPGGNVVLTVSVPEVTASSVGIKYTLPEGLTFVSGRWLLDDGTLSTVSKIGAVFTWSEARTVSGDVLELTLAVAEDAPVYGSIPWEVALKADNTVVHSQSDEAAVQINYDRIDMELSCIGFNIGIGSSYGLDLTLDPAHLDGQARWSSSDESVAVVSNGVVTGCGEGSAVITARLGEFSCQCQVRVFESDADAGVCRFTGEPGCIRHIRCILNNLFS